PSERVLAPGDRVQIRLGEFADMEAIFVSMDGEERVMLLLSLLNREQQIQVGLASIRPAQGRAATFQ
nr:transcription/translation regulatory transformer protein RfaH [Pseudomonas sp.]